MLQDMTPEIDDHFEKRNGFQPTWLDPNLLNSSAYRPFGWRDDTFYTSKRGGHKTFCH